MNIHIDDAGVEVFQVNYSCDFKINSVVLHNSFGKDKIDKYVLNIKKLKYNNYNPVGIFE